MDTLLMETLKRHKKIEMADLPLSLIESNILPRLPATSVGRSMCVCKQWKAFLSTPAFAKMHLRHVTIDDYKLLRLDTTPPATFSTIDGSTTFRFNPSPDPNVELILASLDGLVCLALRERERKRKREREKPMTYQLAFWNPLTGAYKKLSPTPGCKFSRRDAIGFYYIDSCNDYKLLYLVEGGFQGAYIYSQASDSWRKIVFPFCSLIEGRIITWSPATFFNKCLYFMVTDYFAGFKSDKHRIICFDVEIETFKEISFPHVPGEAKYSFGILLVLNGCLHLCVTYTISINDILLKQGDLWRMDSDSDGWVKVAAFNEPLRDFVMNRQYICTHSSANWVAVWDNRGNYLKKMKTEDFRLQYLYFYHPTSRIMYVETLVSPNP